MLLSLLFDIVVVVSVLTLLGLLWIVGIPRLRAARPHAIPQLKATLPYLLLLGLVLLANNYLRDLGPEVSWILGIQIDLTIRNIEGTFVATLQNYAHPYLTTYFSAIYIYGYIFLLVFPVLAYLIHRDSRPAKEIALAYTLNYGIGVICYTIFIAYGPRAFPAMYGENLLYAEWAQAQVLTSEVNTEINVFPSLHTSLSVTVAVLAYRWREIYPEWLSVSIILAGSVAISTMYLGIHWATDVVAGTVLGVFSVWAGAWLTRPERQEGRIGRIGRKLRAPIDAVFELVVNRFQQLYASKERDR